MDLDLPRIFIVSGIDGKADEIAKEMGCKQLLSRDNAQGINYYNWEVDNKYYKAKIILCTTANPTIKVDPDGVEALILYCQAQSALDRVTGVPDAWLPLVSLFSEAEVQILAWDSGTESTDIERVLEWCAQYKFEPVDLNRSVVSNEDDYDEGESTKRGLDRIVEALHARTWPNMELKGGVAPPPMIASTDISEVDQKLEDVHLSPLDGTAEHNSQLEHMLDGMMGGENADFGELFGQLIAMKERAASLPTNERRAAAEELVTAFWKAMGGDHDEIEGLDQ